MRLGHIRSIVHACKENDEAGVPNLNHYAHHLLSNTDVYALFGTISKCILSMHRNVYVDLMLLKTYCLYVDTSYDDHILCNDHYYLGRYNSHARHWLV
jgi:hypothetical protein